MKEEKSILEKLKKKLKFSYEIGENPNNDLFKKIFEDNFIKYNYGLVEKANKNKEYTNFTNFIINPTAGDIQKNNYAYIFTYDYLLKNGLLLELTKNFFQLNINKYQRTLENTIKEINSNKQDFDKNINNYGFELINNLSILYAKINDINAFILGEQLYGEAKSISDIDLNNIIEQSISNVSKNTKDIVGQYYEDSVLLYFLNHSNTDNKSVLPRLLFYMNFIIFNIDNNKIYMEFIPFNQLYKDKTECYNEVDFSFYTTKDIEMPMSTFNFPIFINTLIYNYKEDELIKNYKNDKIYFPEKTLTFFELKNDIKRTDDKKTIILEELISDIKTFISKLPIYMKLYKSKNFINESCNNVKFVYIYDHSKGKLEDSIKAKNMIKNEIDKKFKNIDININIQIIFGNKQIQSINYYELLLENKKTKNELQKYNDRVNALEEELRNMKKILSMYVKNENVELKKEKKEDEEKNIISNEKIDESVKPEKKIIELDEKKMRYNEEIDKLKSNLKGIKLKIFEKAMSMPKLNKYINEYDINMIQNLSKYISEREYKEIDDEKKIEKYVLKLLDKIIKK